MEIAGRVAEKQILEQILEKPTSQFIAMYGRRRIGKTYLIRKTYEKNTVFDCSGLFENTMEQMLENFWLNLSKKSKPTLPTPTSWLKAFYQLEQYINSLPNSEKKKVVFLDEISWFDTPKSGFMGALANFWNNYCTKRNDIVLVICGSAASWIIKNVVNARGGLHNRLSRTIRLNPFTLAETKLFLQTKKVKMADQDICQLYMCVGGIPFYLDQVEQGKSVPQILDDLFFDNNALLAKEFDNLYAALFKNFENHLIVIKALASKNKGLTRGEIIKLTKQNSGGGLSKVLQELEECGFIKKFADFSKSKEDGLYRLMDEFTIFFYKFINNKRGQLKGNEVVASNSFKIWSGFAFENLCFRHLPQIAMALGISGITYNAFSFIDKGTAQSDGSQIDMVIERADNCINIVEMKYHNASYQLTKQEHGNLIKRINSFLKKTKSKKTIFTTLISPHGAIKNEYFLNIVTNEIRLTDLIK
jgi:uncharacterized protein